MTAPNDPANEPENDLNPDGPLPPAMKPERPRDELGRPLPAGEPNRLELPYFDEMTLEECHEEAIRLFDAGNYFGAHEAWETCWGYAKGTDEEEFFKGLAQLGAGYTGIEHFSATLRLGAFLPGSVYSIGADGVTPTSFTEAAYGGQLGLRVEF